MFIARLEIIIKLQTIFHFANRNCDNANTIPQNRYNPFHIKNSTAIFYIHKKKTSSTENHFFIHQVLHRRKIKYQIFAENCLHDFHFQSHPANIKLSRRNNEAEISYPPRKPPT